MTFHRTLRIPAALMASMMVLSPCVAKHYKLFVLTGQSNSLGVTNGGETDPTSGTDAADAHVQFYWHNVVDASTSLGDSAGVFTTLQDQQGGVYTGSATHWGPEIEFSRVLYRAGVRDFGIIKASRGGGGNTNWHKASSGHMYNHVVSTINNATTALTNAGHTFEIIGLLYVQGESDNASEAAVAGARFKQLVDNLRSDLNGASTMRAVIGGITAPGGNRNTVRAQHSQIAASTSYIDYFDNIDLQTQLHDGLHYNRAAKITLGDRFAQAFFQTGIISRHYGKLVFIGDSITQGGGGDYPSYRYTVFKKLAEAGVPNSAATGYQFVGSVTGPYNNASLTTPNVNGQSFSNQHDGHWGWRVSWENGRLPLPASRRSLNRGEGTVLNWTGQANPQKYALNTAGNLVDYPDSTASGTGNTGTTYIPDSAVIMIGINDIADGATATQVRDDIATMIDQLQAANPNIRIYLSQVLYTNQTSSIKAAVDSLNAMFPALAITKTTSTSPVWVITTNDGFDPAALTHDAVHPNNPGESYVGGRIAGGLGITAMPTPGSTAGGNPPVIEKSSNNFTTCFAGNQIYDGSQYINGWSEVTPSAFTQNLTGNIFTHTHTNGAGAWLEGGNSSLDGGTTQWSSGNDGSWTWEGSFKFLSNANGYTVWLGTGSQRIILDIYGDRTETFNGNFTVSHNNLDGNFHTWRVSHDQPNSKYHVWRDGLRLTPVAGVDYDSAGADERMVLGDRTGGAIGDNFQIEIASICYDQTGAYLPTGADADQDGMPDSWEFLHFGDITSGDPTGDDDKDGRNNLDEYRADTDPNSAASNFRIHSIAETSTGTFSITVPDTSPQRNYTLYESDDLGITDNWTAASSPTIGTDGDLVFSSNASGARFYRVVVSIP